MSDLNDKYLKLKEDVQSLSNKKQELDRKIKEVRAMQERKLVLEKEVEKLEAELADLSS